MRLAFKTLFGTRLKQTLPAQLHASGRAFAQLHVPEAVPLLSCPRCLSAGPPRSSKRRRTRHTATEEDSDNLDSARYGHSLQHTSSGGISAAAMPTPFDQRQLEGRQAAAAQHAALQQQLAAQQQQLAAQQAWASWYNPNPAVPLQITVSKVALRTPHLAQCKAPCLLLCPVRLRRVRQALCHAPRPASLPPGLSVAVGAAAGWRDQLDEPSCARGSSTRAHAPALAIDASP